MASSSRLGLRALHNSVKAGADASLTASYAGRVRHPDLPQNYPYRFLAHSDKKIQIIACPFSGGQPRSGVDLGPDKIIAAGLPNQLKSLGYEVSYTGPQNFADIPYLPEPDGTEVLGAKGVKREDDPPIGNMKKPRLVSEVNERVAKSVAAAAEKGWLPLTVGGDHSLAMGTVAGTKAKYPDACLIWVDAHGDINTPETSDTGNMHGMPVSFLLGLPGTNVEPFNKWLKPCLKPSDIVYIGLRDLDTPEKKLMREHNIKCFTMHEVDKYGIGKVMELAIEHVNPTRDRPTHVSFDVDALDPTVAPSTGTPVRGGLTFREGHYIMEAVAETGCLVSLDIMEVNPSLQDPIAVEQTVAVGCSLARAALGETLL